MSTIRIDSNEPVTVIVNGKQADFGPAPGGGGAPSGRMQPVPSVTSMPVPYTDLGSGNHDPRPASVSPGSPVGVRFTIDPNARNERNLRFFGHPGQFWSYNSWAIFDAGGGRVMGEDNVAVVGTLGFRIPEAALMQLGGGTYTLGFACDAGGTLASQFVQG